MAIANPRSSNCSRLPSDDSEDACPNEGTWHKKAPSRPSNQAKGGGGVFAEAEDMKERLKAKLKHKQYNVADFYKETGCWQQIARDQRFDSLTLVIIFLNAIWIWIDTDYNDAESGLLDASMGFVIGENAFCAYFSFEWLVRFMSFQVKRNCLRDSWMVFDSVLVFFMVLETWVLTLVLLSLGGTGGAGLGNTSILRMARLLRLTRMARLARLLRALPELMTMVRGVMASTRSVALTSTLLFGIMYVFGIALRQLTDESDVGELMFDSVPEAMTTLMIDGVFLDSFGLVIRTLGNQSIWSAITFQIFVCMATLTVMNMLIGVVCELVTNVAAMEKDTRTIMQVKEKVMQVLKRIDSDSDCQISKDEFLKLVDEEECVAALNEVGVDVPGLMDLIDIIFKRDDEKDKAEDKDHETTLTFDELIETIYGLRGSNSASVKDIVDLRKFVHQGVARLEGKVSQLSPDSKKAARSRSTVKDRQPEVTHSLEARLGRLEVRVERILQLLEGRAQVGVTRTRL